ncbi:MAG: hypothetical protein IPN90_01050 [Elusimicrobia bacterium]|nr:hypothetical protein [Elusimicrobiota bacterium]
MNNDKSAWRAVIVKYLFLCGTVLLLGGVCARGAEVPSNTADGIDHKDGLLSQ